MELKPGSRWRSAVCSGEFVVVRPPNAAVTLECGGAPLIAYGQPPADGATPTAEHAKGTQAGKRYPDPETRLEVLCSKAGAGSLSVDGRALAPAEAKKLPASD